MDSPSPSRQSGFSARNSSVDVSQLDKVNAIPNKAADDVLLSNLCPEDQYYLKTLMENDSSDSDDEQDPTRHGSSGAWSPMVQSRVVSNKRRMRPSYAITLSLEDISYIRPSWGISKGVRTIEVDGKKKAKSLEKSDSPKELASKDAGAKNEIGYRYFLVILTLVLIFLTLPPYLAEQKRYNNQVSRNKLRIDKKLRTMEIYRPNSDQDQPLGDPILRVNFALGVPANLKPEECTCDVFEQELRRKMGGRQFNRSSEEDKSTCFSCLDWAVRANLRVLVEHQAENEEICYNIKWQSYDSLATPLIDCFTMGKGDQWFGLGDIHSAHWPLNRLNFDWTPLTTNLSAEFSSPSMYRNQQQLSANDSSSLLGSYVNFTLFSTSGIHIGHLRSDFRLSVRVEQASTDEAGDDVQARKICIRARCYEKCSRVWSNRLGDNLNKLRQTNNILEYRICSSAGGAKSLMSNYVNQRIHLLETMVKSRANSTSLLPEGIGLIERTIFATSPEYMPVLDGKTLRQYVDSVVKMGLRTSLILLIDSRWETYIGSLQINTDLFPKWRLLFEIIHNKGFKVILTMKPFVDTSIGAAPVNQLFEAGRLYGISQSLNGGEQDPTRIKETILRRKGLFKIVNETIEIGQNGSTATSRPFVFRCKESQLGYCVLLDLNKQQTRTWLIQKIGRSELLTSNAADGILIGGSHSDSFSWDDHYREGLGELVRQLFFGERIFTLSQWTGNLGYIQLASRPFTWDGLRSVVNSVLNLGLEGFSLIHPGSVWGDMVLNNASTATMTAGKQATQAQARKETIYEDRRLEANDAMELSIRWLQVSIFLPILQFNNLAPIELYGLHDLLQDLVKIRKLHIIAELKRNLPFTPVISKNWSSSTSEASPSSMMPLIRPIWFNQQHLASEVSDTIVAEQFSVGADILVAPVLGEGIRQRDIYLPNGFWHDELRQINIRGGKWLRNYPVELTEVAWFTRLKR